ncbi:helix-turn-helix domain-containing protein [Longitalea arenae]|uniref:helix-turn-helix domain-containing protein n=1 Tax=Longitalea arenae TaxID=2812558 RepID=UPI0019672E36|nr:AraC family transcriptional regulator [Longitalea arenae]
MKQKTLQQPFELYVADMEDWQARPLVYHFFEIVQILDGEGVRLVNDNRFPYSKGSIFLFTPLDCRGFEMQKPTRFCSIRFSEVFLSKCKSAQDRERITQWLRQLEHIFYHHNRFERVLIKQPADCQMISSIIGNMVQEYESKQSFYQENLQHFITLVLNILARHVADGIPSKAAEPQAEPLINRMLLHVHENINKPENLRIAYLAKEFNLSATYVGEYFRKLTGESLQQYIMQYKMQLVQHRLANSALTVSQIAQELGFSDESHLNRQFRKHTGGVGPLEYRKNAKQTKTANEMLRP